MQVITLVLVICTTALHLHLLAHKPDMNFRRAIATSQGIGSAVAFSLSIVVIWPVTALLSYHLRVSPPILRSCQVGLRLTMGGLIGQLLLLNVTTIEQVRAVSVSDDGPPRRSPRPTAHTRARHLCSRGPVPPVAFFMQTRSRAVGGVARTDGSSLSSVSCALFVCVRASAD